MNQPRGSSSKWIIALTTMLGTFMEVLDTSVVNVALPHMKGTYAAGTDEITWVITSYLVANAIILPITGWLGNYVGRKRLYLICLVTFTLASMGCGWAPTLGPHILLRVIQGLSGGAMVPMSQAITLEAFPKEEHGMASALFGIGVIFGPILGPLVGGWITDNWSWPWIYWINIPVGIVAFCLAITFLEDPPYLAKPEGRVDYLSLIFIAVGLGSLEIFLNRGERLDWLASNLIKTFALFAILGIALFIWRSLTAENPLVDLSVFKLPEFAGGMVLTFMTSFGLYAALIMLPLFVQNMLNFTPTWAGVVLSPGGVAAVVAMLVAGKVLGKVSARALITLGILSLTYSTWMLTRIDLNTGIPYMVMARVFNGIGMGFAIVTLASATVVRVPPHLLGNSSGIFNLCRNEGGSVGIAVATTFLTQRAQYHQARLVEHVTIYHAPFQQGVARLKAGLFPWAGLDPTSVSRLAHGLIGAEVVRQSYVKSFVDIFGFLSFAFLITLPFVFFLQGPSRSKAGATDHVHSSSDA